MFHTTNFFSGGHNFFGNLTADKRRGKRTPNALRERWGGGGAYKSELCNFKVEPSTYY